MTFAADAAPPYFHTAHIPIPRTWVTFDRILRCSFVFSGSRNHEHDKIPPLFLKILGNDGGGRRQLRNLGPSMLLGSPTPGILVNWIFSLGNNLQQLQRLVKNSPSLCPETDLPFWPHRCALGATYRLRCCGQCSWSRC